MTDATPALGQVGGKLPSLPSSALGWGGRFTLIVLWQLLTFPVSNKAASTPEPLMTRRASGEGRRGALSAPLPSNVLRSPSSHPPVSSLATQKLAPYKSISPRERDPREFRKRYISIRLRRIMKVHSRPLLTQRFCLNCRNERNHVAKHPSLVRVHCTRIALKGLPVTFCRW